MGVFPEAVCQGLEVLHDGGEVELVTCAGETPQTHSLEAVVGLQVRKNASQPSCARLPIGRTLAFASVDDLVIRSGWAGLHIDNHCVFDVDQIINTESH